MSIFFNRLNPCSTGITFLTVRRKIRNLLDNFSLNPCSTGITFLTLRFEQICRYCECLNPCSTGITFLTKLLECSTRSLNPCSTGITFLTSYQKHCLNPCSTGITFLTAKKPTYYPSTPCSTFSHKPLSFSQKLALFQTDAKIVIILIYQRTQRKYFQR